MIRDDIDLRLLDELQRDAGRPLEQLGRIVGLSTSAVSRRIRRYRESGILLETVALLDPSAVGVGIHAVCQITCHDDSSGELGDLKRRLLERSEVIQCYEVAGNIDLIVVFASPSMAHYTQLTDDLLTDNPIVRRFESHIALRVSRPTARIPLPTDR